MIAQIRILYAFLLKIRYAAIRISTVFDIIMYYNIIRTTIGAMCSCLLIDYTVLEMENVKQILSHRYAFELLYMG